ncbi:hypothetical protein NW806_05680 [Synechococcus sp. W65.1]|uniref:hypothetical protein n=1 Tax=Synechococcus sp. W65.1 TaxID=2964526 RepID=UPI0039C0EFD7
MLERFQVQAGISSGSAGEAVVTWFRQRQRPLYLAERVGAVTWSRQGVQTLRAQEL